jgi:hypothetical protein
MKLKLAEQWKQRLELQAEAEMLWDEGDKLRDEGSKKLMAEGDKLRAEANKLLAEADILWADAILESYGNITLEWKFNGKDSDCILENGEHYKC